MYAPWVRIGRPTSTIRPNAITAPTKKTNRGLVRSAATGVSGGCMVTSAPGGSSPDEPGRTAPVVSCLLPLLRSTEHRYEAGDRCCGGRGVQEHLDPRSADAVRL